MSFAWLKYVAIGDSPKLFDKSSSLQHGSFQLWTTDSGTFPVVIICSFAAVAAGASASRYLLHNPDVCFDKSKRNSSMHYQSEDGAIGARSRQFDPAFAKEENKTVSR
ncbi:NADH-ubiquinone reductase complex 1 MLRQ subunit [Phytophthora cactorum]|nr:NADH-ubiquinone reductase complex 1 MLRQ subunit [Phytophthora cactorum]